MSYDQEEKTPQLTESEAAMLAKYRRKLNTYVDLNTKYGSKQLKIYSVLVKIIFFICIFFMLFALIRRSIPLVLLCGILAFVSCKASRLFKMAAKY